MKEKQRKTRRTDLRHIHTQIGRSGSIGVVLFLLTPPSSGPVSIPPTPTKSVALLSRIGSVKKGPIEVVAAVATSGGRASTEERSVRLDTSVLLTCGESTSTSISKKGRLSCVEGNQPTRRRLEALVYYSQPATFVYRRGGQGERTGRTEMCCR